MVKEGGGEGGGGVHPALRGLALVVAVPALVLISVVGALVWLVCVPLRCVCPCLPVGLAWWAVEWALKAPFRGLLWATGGDWHPGAPPGDGGGEAGRPAAGDAAV